MSDAEQKPHIMSSLTDKGYFALDLIAQGISPTHKELDQLWKDANQRGKSTNQPESDHLQQAPEMIGELRDKLDEAIPEDLPSNIREMAIEEIEQFFNAHLQATRPPINFEVDGKALKELGLFTKEELQAAVANTFHAVEFLPATINMKNHTKVDGYLVIDRPKSSKGKWRAYYTAPSYGKKHMVEHKTFGGVVNALLQQLKQGEA